MNAQKVNDAAQSVTRHLSGALAAYLIAKGKATPESMDVALTAIDQIVGSVVLLTTVASAVADKFKHPAPTVESNNANGPSGNV